MKKNIIALMLSAIMLLSVTTAMAVDVNTDGGTGETTVTLTAEAATFSVTCPTSIPIHINADGTVTCPSGIAITSASSAPVRVTDVSIANGAWTIVGYDAANMAAEQVGSNKLALSMTVGTTAVKTADMTGGATRQDLGDPAWGTIASKTGSQAITIAAKASAVSSAISTAQTAATVTFTVGWAE